MLRLWENGPVLAQARDVFPLGTDALLLADFARMGRRDRLLDLGTGCGVLPAVMLWDRPEASATAVEVDPAACRLARENFAQNGLSDRVRLVEGDLREFRNNLPMGAFDLTVANPPYFRTGSGRDAALKNARGDGSCSLADMCQAAKWGTRWGGRFCVVFRPERLAELFFALAQNGFSPKRMRPVRHGPSMPVSLVLVEARRGGGPGLRWEQDLYLRDSEGNDSAEMKRIYRREEE